MRPAIAAFCNGAGGRFPLQIRALGELARSSHWFCRRWPWGRTSSGT